MTSKQSYIILIITLLLTIIVYSSSRKFSFVNWDDDKYVYDNPDITKISLQNTVKFFSTPYVGMYQPITMLSFPAEYKLASKQDIKSPWYLPHFMHMTNLLFHLLNTILVFIFSFLLFRKNTITIVCTFVFALHPAHVESIAWISERKDLLYTFFYLLSLIFYLKHKHHPLRKKYLILCFLSFLFSLLSKSAAVTLPLVLILIDWFKDKKLNGMILIEKIPFFLFSFIFGIISLQSQGAGSLQVCVSHYNLFDRLLMIPYSLYYYIQCFLVPIELSAIHPYPHKTGHFLPPVYFIVFILLVLLVTLLIRFRKKNILDEENSFGLLFYIITLLLVIQIIPLPGYAIVAERYSYLPYIGISIISANIWEIIRKFLKINNSLNLTICILDILLLAFLSFQRVSVWKDSTTLFNNVIKTNPDVALSYNNIGMIKNEEGHYKEGLQYLDKAIVLCDNSPLTFYNRGLSKFNLSDIHGAISDYSRAISLKPNYQKAYSNRGTSRQAANDLNGALEDFNTALKLAPNEYMDYYNRGNTKLYMKLFPEAISDYNQALAIKPDYLYALHNRGLAKMYNGDLSGASNDFTEVINHDKSYGMAYLNRANVRILQKDFPNACNDLIIARTNGIVQSNELIKIYCK